jgi:hypothetical protein
LLPDVPEAARRTYVGRVFASVRQAIITATWAQCVGDLMALPVLPGMVQMSLRTDALHKSSIFLAPLLSILSYPHPVSTILV